MQEELTSLYAIAVPDFFLVGVGEFENGFERRHATMHERRPEVMLLEAEVKPRQHACTEHLHQVRGPVANAEFDLAAAQHRLTRRREAELTQARFAAHHATALWRQRHHRSTARRPLANLHRVVEVELARVDDVKVANGALIELNLT